jgi:hypothetical protein
MKKIRRLNKTFGVLLGALGLSAMFTSCHKERTCNCTQSMTYTYQGGQSSTYSQQVTQKTEQKCWELNESTEYSYGGATYSQSISCD